MSNKSHLLINEQALQVLPSLAVAIGLNEAIALQQIHYWLNNAKNAGRIDKDGNKWVYNTYSQWKEDNFPFWSEDKIQRIFLSLEKQEVLISRQLDAKMRDMTKFYRIDYDKLCALDGLKSASSMTAKLHDVKMNQRLPEITTEPDNSIPDNYPLDWYIQHGLPIPPHLIDQNQMAANAVNEFESKLGFSSLPWDSTAEWQKFKKWVIATYSGRLTAWEDYSDWRKAKGKYDAMSNKQIRMNPSVFMDTGWPSFLASFAMYNDDEKTRLL